MKAKPYKNQLCAYAHIKRDGIWLEVKRTTLGLSCWTRTPDEIGDKLKHCNWFAPPMLRLPKGYRVYGELWVPGRKASYVSSAIAKQEQLRFSAFASPDLGDTLELGLLNDQLALWGFDTVPWLAHEDIWPRQALVGNSGRFFDPHKLLHNLPPDCEGYVLKNGNLQDWYKLKPVKTVDVVVVDVKDGKGKYLGLVGALVVAIEGRVVANVSGMDDETRIECSDNDPTGRVCEVRYQYVGDKGKLRHPAFVRWRKDKRPDECTLDQDEDL